MDKTFDFGRNKQGIESELNKSIEETDLSPYDKLKK
jgi:hypothetical protein